MKDMNSRKSNTISMRMNDEEFAYIQRLMDINNKKASSIMHEAFSLLKQEWEMSGRLERV
jgi:Mg/Co/Ni transporter MgtE